MPDSKWPEYLPGPREDILALGVIALNYCQLESMFSFVFCEAAAMTPFQAQVLFQRVPNNVRLEMLEQLLSPRADIPDWLKEDTRYFASGYSVCANNRNDIMHSHSGGIHVSLSKGTTGLILRKYSRAGNELMCPVDAAMLRQIADDTHAYMLYGAHITSDLSMAASRHRKKDARPFLPVSSIDKPAIPAKLNWMTPATFQESFAPPQSSRG